MARAIPEAVELQHHVVTAILDKQIAAMPDGERYYQGPHNEPDSPAASNCKAFINLCVGLYPDSHDIPDTIAESWSEFGRLWEPPEGDVF